MGKNCSSLTYCYTRLRLNISKRILFVYLIGISLAVIGLINSTRTVDISSAGQAEERYRFTRSKQWPVSKTAQNTNTRPSVGIFIVIDNPSSLPNYKLALDSVECYAKAQNYSLEMVFLNNISYSTICPQTDVSSLLFSFHSYSLTCYIDCFSLCR